MGNDCVPKACMTTKPEDKVREKYAYESFRRVPNLGCIDNWMQAFENQNARLKQNVNSGQTGAFGKASLRTNIQMGNFPSDTSVDQYNGNKVEMGKGGAQRRKDDILSYPSLEAIGKNGEYSNSLNIFNLKSLTNTVPLNSRSSTGISLLQVCHKDKNTVVKKVLKSDYDELVRRYAGTTEMYTDKQFPPDRLSLGDVSIGASMLTWQRLSAVLLAPVFIKDSIDPRDVLQGGLGDCYYLSAVAALAEVDLRIKKLFPNLQMNKNGIYMVRVLYNGVLRQIVVDDCVPTFLNSKIAFAQPMNGVEIWVCIIEKAWAKLSKSYANTEGGLPGEVMHCLSGAPTQLYIIPEDKTDMKALEKVWSSLLRNYNKGYLLCCGTVPDPTIESSGWVPSHAYTILGVYSITISKLLKVRNPWGKRQWKGSASQYDTQFWSQISQQDKKMMKYSNKQLNDGIFFIKWGDFTKYVNLVEICKIDDNAHYDFLEVLFQNKVSKIFYLNVEASPNNNTLTIALTQKSHRGTPQREDLYGVSTIIVGKVVSDTQVTFIKGAQGGKFFNDQYLHFEAESGKYLVLADFNWKYTSSDTATMSTYTQNMVSLSEVQKGKFMKFLKLIYMDMARKSEKKRMLGTDGWTTTDYNDACRMGYIVIEMNKNATKPGYVDLIEDDFTKNNLELEKPYCGKGRMKLCVPPGQWLAIGFKNKAQLKKVADPVIVPVSKVYVE